jgi:hypothetical protein
MNTSTGRLIAAIGAAVVALTTLAAADDDPIASYTAQAVDITAPAGAATGRVEIQITRWSTDPERDQLNTALWEKGQEAMLDVLRHLPTVGVIRGTGQAGYDLRYARKTEMNGGNQQVILATDRPISFWESSTIAESTQYPFAVIELRLKPNGEGEGRMSIAARLSANKATKTLMLENYTAAQVQLQNVRADK